MAREIMSPRHEKFVQLLKNKVRPIDVFDLNTSEGRKISAAYKVNGYWLSEMYQYMPEMRSDLKVVISQLKNLGKL